MVREGEPFMELYVTAAECLVLPDSELKQIPTQRLNGRADRRRTSDNGTDHHHLLAGIKPTEIVELKLKLARTAKLKVKRALLEAQYVKRSDVRTEFRAYLHTIEHHVLQAPRSLSPRLKKVYEDQMTKALREVLREARETLMRELEQDEGKELLA